MAISQNRKTGTDSFEPAPVAFFRQIQFISWNR